MFPLNIDLKSHSVRWNDKERDFNGIPFYMLGWKLFDCQHGKDRKESFKKKGREKKSPKLVSKRFIKGFDLMRLSVYIIL